MKKYLTLAVATLAAVSVTACTSTDPTKPDTQIKVQNCQWYYNADGSAQTIVHLHNTGKMQKGVAVITTLHLYGGNTKDDSDFFNEPTYDIGPGYGYVPHTFNLGPDDQPVSCSAKVVR